MNIGYVIQVYYIIDSKASEFAINFGNYKFPDLSTISFLEYVEILNRRLINVKNRKTQTDHNGGLYPTLQKIYEEYLKRSNVELPLKASNGYTFLNLYPFINKFNSYFNKFIDQLLSSTIILKKGGVLVRNTSFTKQKFPYKRGVNFNQGLKYLGDDGSEFKIILPELESIPLYIYTEEENNPVYIFTEAEGKTQYLFTNNEIES